MSSALRKAGFKIVDTIDTAAVPIGKPSLVCSRLLLIPSSVIFTDPRTGLSCDLNINDRLGLLNTYLIKHYCELNPALVDMIVYIKQWAKPLGLNSPSSRKKGPITFSSYALVMMSIGFLQVAHSAYTSGHRKLNNTPLSIGDCYRIFRKACPRLNRACCMGHFGCVCPSPCVAIRATRRIRWTGRLPRTCRYTS